MNILKTFLSTIDTGTDRAGTPFGGPALRARYINIASNGRINVASVVGVQLDLLNFGEKESLHFVAVTTYIEFQKWYGR